MKVDWKVDDTGQMRGFSYHDGSLETLEWKKAYLRLRIAAVDGSVSIVELRDLDSLMLQLWEGVIISDLFAWPIDAVPEEQWDMNDGAWRTLLSGRMGRSSLKAAAAEIVKRNPTAFLVQMLTSYGGTMAAVCKTINVAKETSTAG